MDAATWLTTRPVCSVEPGTLFLPRKEYQALRRWCTFCGCLLLVIVTTIIPHYYHCPPTTASFATSVHCPLCHQSCPPLLLPPSVYLAGVITNARAMMLLQFCQGSQCIISCVEFIESTYEGPNTKKSGRVHLIWREHWWRDIETMLGHSLEMIFSPQIPYDFIALVLSFNSWSILIFCGNSLIHPTPKLVEVISQYLPCNQLCFWSYPTVLYMNCGIWSKNISFTNLGKANWSQTYGIGLVCIFSCESG